MDKVKIIKGAVGTVELSAGVLLRLAELGLSVSEVVLSGAKNLANSFVKGPDLNIGSSMLNDLKKQTEKLAGKLIQKGKGRF